MSKLLSFRDLFSEGWQAIRPHWSRAIQLGSWFLFSSALLLLSIFFVNLTDIGFFKIILFLAFFLAGVSIMLFTNVRLMQFVLAIQDEKKSDHHLRVQDGSAWALTVSVVWIGVLQSLAIVGGLILLIIPGLWLALALSYAVLASVDKGHRGTKALSASFAIVRHRWWSVLWRVLLLAVISSAIFSVFQTLVQFVLGLVIGFDKITALSTGSFVNITTVDTAHLILPFVLTALSEMLFLPLVLSWQIRLYRHLRDTAEPEKKTV